MTVDADGVQMIFPAKTGGTSYRLGDRNPECDREHLKLWADTLTPMTENGVGFWRSTGQPITYAGGGDGTSHRLIIIAAAGTQQFNWKNGAIEHGHCGSPRDLDTFEATVYCRLRDRLEGKHESVSWAIRGGRHNGDDASCIGMNVKNPPALNPVFKELTHPKYGYNNIRTLFDYTKAHNAWLGIKIVSYICSPTQVRNLMYLDTAPYGENGTKNNNWRHYLEWFDTQGMEWFDDNDVVIGDYTQAALWAGWTTTFRVDGWKYMDFSILSAREIDTTVAKRT